MSLDLAGLLVLAAGSLAGALGGALRQLVHLGALALGALAARALGPALVGAMAGAGASAALARPLASLAVLVAVFAAASLVGHLLLRAARGHGPRPAADRGLGALLGGVQAGLAVWAAVSLLAAWGRPVGPAALGLDPGHGDLGAIGREHSLLDAWAPAEADALRRQLPALRDAGTANPLERARQAAEAADRALQRQAEQLEKAAR